MIIDTSVDLKCVKHQFSSITNNGNTVYS